MLVWKSSSKLSTSLPMAAEKKLFGASEGIVTKPQEPSWALM